MRTAWIVVATAGVVVLTAGVAAQLEQAGSPAYVGAANGMVGAAQRQEPGKAIFEGKGNCAACHGRDAKGTPLGPDLTDGEWLHIDGTLAEIAAIIRSGVLEPKKYPAPMPPLGGARLRDAEIDAVARYVHELQPPD